MKTVLQVDGLKKTYGTLEALKGVSFEVHEGEIFGLIGPNGAGKTTTLRIISTLLSPSGGMVVLNGFDLKKNPEKFRELISYLPEEAGAYRNLTGMDYLRFMSNFYAETAERSEEYINRAVAIAELGNRLDEKVGTYSKGMVRKLLLARALMTKPVLTILDDHSAKGYSARGDAVQNALTAAGKAQAAARQHMAALPDATRATAERQFAAVTRLYAGSSSPED
ncbi:MAG: ABC transporter ATP-binding protein, partial [Acidobacteriota bacterium]|nr:ABC transporter ATP-binding protein [Acidobacteriota bacterium]